MKLLPRVDLKEADLGYWLLAGVMIGMAVYAIVGAVVWGP